MRLIQNGYLTYVKRAHTLAFFESLRDEIFTKNQPTARTSTARRGMPAAQCNGSADPSEGHWRVRD